MPTELNEKQELLFFNIILYNRGKLNFEPSFDEMADLPTKAEWGCTVNAGNYYNPAYDTTGHSSTVTALLKRKLVTIRVGKDYDYKDTLFLTSQGRDYLFALESRLQKYFAHEAQLKKSIVSELDFRKAKKEREAQDVQKRIERIDAMRENPPQVGEYLLFHHNSQEEPKLVYVEHVYPDTEKVHARELGSRTVDNAGWQYLERVDLSRLPSSPKCEQDHNGELHFSYLRMSATNQLTRRAFHLDYDTHDKKARVYLSTCDTLEELKVFQLMLTEFIILQEKWIEQKKREVPNVSPATAAYLAKHPTAKLIEEGYINVILPPQED